MKKVSIKNIQKKKKGFTLVELIIVIAIIAILAAMAIPKFSAVRIEGKVSNDVAAAKNIQIATAMLLANGDLTADQTFKLSDTNGKGIKDRLDGKVSSTGVTEATGKDFTIVIGKNESIEVQADGCILYPDADGNGKKAYLAKAAGDKSTGSTSS